MSVEFIGMISPQEYSEIIRPQGPVDRSGLHAPLRPGARGRPDFDRVPRRLLLHRRRTDSSWRLAAPGHRPHRRPARPPARLRGADRWRPASSPRSTSSAAAGWPCTSSPGGSDEEQRRDGDFLTRTSATGAPTSTSKSCAGSWTSPKPFDHEGGSTASSAASPRSSASSSRTCRSTSAARRTRPSTWPAVTPTSTRCGASRCAEVRETIARVRASAARHGRQVRFSVSFRPILAATEDAAWARAQRIYDEAAALGQAAGLGDGDPKQSEGARRLLAAAAQGERVDGRSGRRSPGSTEGGRTPPRWWGHRRRSPTRSSTTTTSGSRRS